MTATETETYSLTPAKAEEFSAHFVKEVATQEPFASMDPSARFEGIAKHYGIDADGFRDFWTQALVHRLQQAAENADGDMTDEEILNQIVAQVLAMLLMNSIIALEVGREEGPR